MANTKESTVIFVDTTSTVLKGPIRVEAIKYIGNASGTATIVSGSAKMWEARGTADVTDKVGFFAPNDLTVSVTNGATVYIYIK